MAHFDICCCIRALRRGFLLIIPSWPYLQEAYIKPCSYVFRMHQVFFVTFFLKNYLFICCFSIISSFFVFFLYLLYFSTLIFAVFYLLFVPFLDFTSFFLLLFLVFLISKLFFCMYYWRRYYTNICRSSLDTKESKRWLLPLNPEGLKAIGLLRKQLSCSLSKSYTLAQKILCKFKTGLSHDLLLCAAHECYSWEHILFLLTFWKTAGWGDHYET